LYVSKTMPVELTDGAMPRAGLLCPYGAKQLSTGGGNPACGVGPVR